MNKEELMKLFEFDEFEKTRFYNKKDMENIIKQVILNHKLYTSELEAKVYTYEKIIANSNFKAINNKSVESLKKKIKELEEEIQVLKGDSNE